jgi:hypothetical protein
MFRDECAFITNLGRNKLERRFSQRTILLGDNEIENFEREINRYDVVQEVVVKGIPL